ncbi:PREDICTED: uncharacterized protein LOC109187005 [Ipomoea nil]|uniref:uncharacterized protein LOC109187005 n=1 Tax=Ipomoea nil TaxID=35883 RepID=UPI000901A967|nr:PREDICTED: uncharacterized protein LOC109187005 [Ipomoea nil]
MFRPRGTPRSSSISISMASLIGCAQTGFPHITAIQLAFSNAYFIHQAMVANNNWPSSIDLQAPFPSITLSSQPAKDDLHPRSIKFAGSNFRQTSNAFGHHLINGQCLPPCHGTNSTRHGRWSLSYVFLGLS